MLNVFYKKNIEKRRYFNYFFSNMFLNMFFKRGCSRSFKKLYLKFFFYLKNHYIFKKTYGLCFYYNSSFDSLLKNFLLGKPYTVYFCSTKNKTYVNHRRVYIEKINFSINKTGTRGFYFIRFLKYFFFRKSWKNNLKFFMSRDLCNKKSSLIYNVYVKTVTSIILKSV